MPDFTAAETEAAMALIRTCMDQRTDYEDRKPLPTEILLAEIDRLRAALTDITERFEKCLIFSGSDPEAAAEAIQTIIAKDGDGHG